MTSRFNIKSVVMSMIVVSIGSPAWSAKLVEVRSIDNEYLMVHWQDGIVEYKDDGQGQGAYMGHETGGGDVLKMFDPALNIANAANVTSYTVASTDDVNYSAPLHPSLVHRKSKVNGTTNKWPEPPFTLEHTCFLRLPRKMQQGKHYTLNIAPGTNSDVTYREFVFDIFTSVSEAIHVNIIGYSPDTAMKSGDLYMWLGDGGGRDYSSYVGRKVMLSERGHAANNRRRRSRVLEEERRGFRRLEPDRGPMSGIATSLRSPAPAPIAWRSRASAAAPSFRISRGRLLRAIPDIGPRASSTCASARTRTSSRCPDSRASSRTWTRPTSRSISRPLAPGIPTGRNSGGDVWDKQDWSAYKEPGKPTNPNAWGGHSDAADWDRNLATSPSSGTCSCRTSSATARSATTTSGSPRAATGFPTSWTRPATRWTSGCACATATAATLRPQQPQQRTHDDVPGGRQAVHGVGQRRQRRHARRRLPHRRPG